jgi:DNA-binding response OmpR family regulator
MKILMTTTDRQRVALFAQGLESRGDVSLVWAGSGEEALTQTREGSPDLAVIAEDLEDMSAFALVARLMATDAMINTVVLSDMDPDEFHEAGEGLGILAQLPASPASGDAQELFTKFTTVRGL